MFKSPNTRTELDKMIPVPKSPLTPAAMGGVRGSSSRPYGLEPVFNGPNLMDGQLNVFRLVQPAEENRVERIRDDELENQSGSEMGQEVVSGDEEDDHVDANGQKKIKKRRRYHRHTQYQIQAMETFFKECPHPDDKQRKELGVDLGLKPLQIKFWFQNKRTQLKMQQERQENSQLRVDNERLRLENMRYKEALDSAACPACGSPTALGELSFDEHQLRVENSRLRHEVDRITAVAAKYTGKPMLNLTIDSPPLNGQFVGGGEQLYGAGDMFRSIVGLSAPQIDKQMILEFAVVAMEELIGMAQYGEPLWIPNIDSNSCNFVLNEDEYFRAFPRDLGLRQPPFKSEASRAIAVVMMCPNNLADIFMDVHQWSTMFAGIIANATTLEILSPGVGGTSNGALQMMNAEFQVLSPVVPTREMHFVRYCKHHVDGSWTVVDFSPDSLFPSPFAKCRRRPSGCLIQEMPNGYSKVTWIEHVEVEDKPIHNIYRPLVNSGLAFGAKRWVCTLDRQCERFASTVAANVLPTDVSISEGRKGLLKVAERMVISFCGGVSASIAHTWTTLSGSGADDVRVMTRKIFNDPGRPSGTVISAATSFWLPSPTKKVFDFLRNEQYRTEVSQNWDILSNGGAVEEVAHISNSREMGNCLSLFRVNMHDETQNGMLILQESGCDPTGSFVVYAPVDDHGINMVLSGGNPDNVALLPSGFAILPDGPTTLHGGTGGTLVTVAFQILVDSAPSAKLSIGTVATVNNLITCTVERIKAAVGNPNA